MKKLLRDAWRAVTEKKNSHPRHIPKGDAASRIELKLAAVDTSFNDALTAQQAGRLPEAQAAYRGILEIMPDYAPALHFLGVSHGQAGDFVAAERLIRQSIQLRELPEYFSNLAKVLDKLGKPDEAELAYRNVLKLDPKSFETHCSLGDLLVGAARYSDAEQAYRGALVLQPDDAETYFKLGVVLAELNRITDAVEAYRLALVRRPAYLDAYNNLGNLLKVLRQYSDAENAYKQALLLQPGVAPLHCNLGQLLQDTGRYAEAEAAYRRALSLQPNFAGAHNNLGNLYVATGRHSEAEAAYRRALALQPDYVDVYNNLGNLLKEMSRCSEAEAAYRRALSLRPDYADAWGNLGMLLEDAGQLDEAEAAHRKALILKPDSAIVHNNLANLFCKTGRISEAEASYRKALELDPDYSEVSSNLGALLHESGRMTEAEILYRKALARNPDSAAAHNNFGFLLVETRRYTEAEAVLGRALALQPDFADAYVSLGNLYKETDRYAEAEAAYRRAIALQPELAGAHNNLGFLLQGAERFVEAEAAYCQALTLDPDLDLARYNWALLCLSQKRFQDGWKGFDRRWKIKDFNSLQRQFPQPQWQGEALSGKAILVWQEQGVGDIILYAGMISDLMEKGARVIVECESRLVPLLARSFPKARVLARSNPAHIATREARWQSALGSLGGWLRARQEDFTWRGPYLIPEATQVAAFRQRYRKLGQGPVIGIAWRSSNEKVGLKKSMSLAEWAPLLALPGAIFVNLQYGDCEDELSQLQRDTGISVHCDSTVNSLKDLDGFAAQVASMDLVISTSNSTVHFAGALGVQVWTLLPKGGGGLIWYWLNEGNNSLWYPSMQLFRQEMLGDWSGPLARATKALRGFLLEYR